VHAVSLGLVWQEAEDYLMPIIYRVSSRHEGKRPAQLKPSTKRWTFEKLLVAVRSALDDHVKEWGTARYVQ